MSWVLILTSSALFVTAGDGTDVICAEKRSAKSGHAADTVSNVKIVFWVTSEN